MRATLASPRASLSADAVRCTSASSLSMARPTAVSVTSGAGAPAIAAEALATRRTPSSSLARTSGLYERMVPRICTESGMMLPTEPPLIAPMVTTPNWVGSFSRLISVCTSTTKRAAMAIGSSALSGAEPWPPRPLKVIDGVRVRRDDAAVVADGAVWRRPAVQRERVVRIGEALEQAVVEHGAGAAADFLGRLGDEHQRAFPLRLQRDERAGGADPAGHVDVVAAAVRHHGVLAVEQGVGLAGIGDAG